MSKLNILDIIAALAWETAMKKGIHIEEVSIFTKQFEEIKDFFGSKLPTESGKVVLYTKAGKIFITERKV